MESKELPNSNIRNDLAIPYFKSVGLSYQAVGDELTTVDFSSTGGNYRVFVIDQLGHEPGFAQVAEIKVQLPIDLSNAGNWLLDELASISKQVAGYVEVAEVQTGPAAIYTIDWLYTENNDWKDFGMVFAYTVGVANHLVYPRLMRRLWTPNERDEPDSEIASQPDALLDQ